MNTPDITIDLDKHKRFLTSKATFRFWFSEPSYPEEKDKNIYDVLYIALKEYASKNNISLGVSWIEIEPDE
jgi:hypothetical protein